jgi:hypothetical protein
VMPRRNPLFSLSQSTAMDMFFLFETVENIHFLSRTLRAFRLLSANCHSM